MFQHFSASFALIIAFVVISRQDCEVHLVPKRVCHHYLFTSDCKIENISLCKPVKTTFNNPRCPVVFCGLPKKNETSSLPPIAKVTLNEAANETTIIKGLKAPNVTLAPPIQASIQVNRTGRFLKSSSTSGLNEPGLTIRSELQTNVTNQDKSQNVSKNVPKPYRSHNVSDNVPKLYKSQNVSKDVPKQYRSHNVSEEVPKLDRLQNVTIGRTPQRTVTIGGEPKANLTSQNANVTSNFKQNQAGKQGQQEGIGRTPQPTVTIGGEPKANLTSQNANLTSNFKQNQEGKRGQPEVQKSRVAGLEPNKPDPVAAPEQGKITDPKVQHGKLPQLVPQKAAQRDQVAPERGPKVLLPQVAVVPLRQEVEPQGQVLPVRQELREVAPVRQEVEPQGQVAPVRQEIQAQIGQVGPVRELKSQGVAAADRVLLAPVHQEVASDQVSPVPPVRKKVQPRQSEVVQVADQSPETSQEPNNVTAEQSGQNILNGTNDWQQETSLKHNASLKSPNVSTPDWPWLNISDTSGNQEVIHPTTPSSMTLELTSKPHFLPVDGNQSNQESFERSEKLLPSSDDSLKGSRNKTLMTKSKMPSFLPIDKMTKMIGTERDCVDRFCILNFEVVENCIVYSASETHRTCDVPCDVRDCKLEIFHNVMCPLWVCTLKPTTPSPSPSPSPSPPEPPSPFSCSTPSCVAAASSSGVMGIFLVFLAILLWKKTNLAHRLRARLSNYERLDDHESNMVRERVDMSPIVTGSAPLNIDANVNQPASLNRTSMVHESSSLNSFFGTVRNVRARQISSGQDPNNSEATVPLNSSEAETRF